jgi:monooxygenase
LGAVRLSVDGTPVQPGEAFVYKGAMLSNVPNFAFCIGYTNASWTLRADLTTTFVCRVLNHMNRHSYATCIAVCDPATMESRPLLDLTSGYVMRAAASLPKQAARQPWIVRQNYILDMLKMKLGRLEDGTLKFARVFPATRTAPQEEVATHTSA